MLHVYRKAPVMSSMWGVDPFKHKEKRRDKCECGSGKMYKKCCLNKKVW